MIDDNKKRLNASESVKDVVAFLRLLIQGKGTDPIPPIFIGNDPVKTVSAGLNLKYYCLIYIYIYIYIYI